MVKTELEVWENASHSQLYIQKYDSRGNIVHEAIQGRRRVSISSDERRLNQDLAATPEQDFFANGTLVPVKLIESEADTAELKGNANAMNDEDMKAVFKLALRPFGEKVDAISNPIVIRRLLEVASDVDASIKQVEKLQARLAGLIPAVNETVAVGGGPGSTISGKGRGVTPK
jgi:hypothetical protein